MPRLEGDLPNFWSNASIVFEKLDWKPHFKIDQMCKDAWLWQKNNARGYDIDNSDDIQSFNTYLKDQTLAKN